MYTLLLSPPKPLLANIYSSNSNSHFIAHIIYNLRFSLFKEFLLSRKISESIPSTALNYPRTHQVMAPRAYAQMPIKEEEEEEELPSSVLYYSLWAGLNVGRHATHCSIRCSCRLGRYRATAPGYVRSSLSLTSLTLPTLPVWMWA